MGIEIGWRVPWAAVLRTISESMAFNKNLRLWSDFQVVVGSLLKEKLEEREQERTLEIKKLLKSIFH